MISLVAVIGKNHELGKDNRLLWHVPGDLPRFKKITQGYPVVMGRKTYESIGRPLPGRTNVVVSRSVGEIAGVVVCKSLEEALEHGKKAEGGEEVFVIGGGEIYTQAISVADRLYLTIVEQTAEADTYFPEYSEFGKVIEEQYFFDSPLPHKFVILER